MTLSPVTAGRLLSGGVERAAMLLRRMRFPRARAPGSGDGRPGIAFCQLNDDESGSPRVLVHAMQALADRFANPLVFVSTSQSGGFIGRSGVAVRRYFFRKSLRHPWLALSFAAGQVELAFRLLLAKLLPQAPIYVNTCFPVGAAIFGALTRRPVIFHSHEIPRTRLELALFALMVRCSTIVLCVSHAHASQLPVPPSRRNRLLVVANALDPQFCRVAASTRKGHRSSGSFRVLYATSALSPQKGFPEFLLLAEALRGREDIELVLATPSEEAPRLPPDLPRNVHVRCGEPDLGALYAGSDVVLNLSRPDLSVETFGLTILEAMAFGTPALVPPAGGPAELVREGREGYHVDARDTRRLVDMLSRLADEETLWLQLSDHARRRAVDFSFAAFERDIGRALDLAQQACRPG